MVCEKNNYQAEVTESSAAPVAARDGETEASPDLALDALQAQISPHELSLKLANYLRTGVHGPVNAKGPRAFVS